MMITTERGEEWIRQKVLRGVLEVTWPAEITRVSEILRRGGVLMESDYLLAAALQMQNGVTARGDGEVVVYHLSITHN